ncbi:hypothetical protein KSC_010110 [Ktedonobacter sp. SOSP1-52]|nr:hypothetical protein KSC_010110 [Ktedonobacter sp. SOSP1-52]
MIISCIYRETEKQRKYVAKAETLDDAPGTHRATRSFNLSARPISQHNAPLLGKLLYEAYRNTIDDEGEASGEAQKEIEGTFAGKYGPVLTTCSFLIEEQEHILAASVLIGQMTGQERNGRYYLFS